VASARQRHARYGLIGEAIRLSPGALQAEPTDFQAAVMLPDIYRKRIDLLEKANRVLHRL